ncbi:MAG: AAA family ATPase [Candidatus Paceibacterota bacterium]
MSNFLKGIELQGFKSFAGKIDFKINDKVVAVVGPNGSGKSNIIDALRWAMGEREAKNLRGEVLGNLIFAGTPKRGASSLARVTLNFDNSKGLFPVDSNEINLTRRIDKSGTSQFFVNDEEVRLKDLIPMLAKARLGARGLTIIGQGQSDVFVTRSPEERRLMIEEILGLKEFRLKKKTAERRLRRSTINAEKVEAKIEEIRPHLKFLRKQKNKWEKRSVVEEKLKELSETYFTYHYNLFSEKIDLFKEKINNLNSKKSEKEKRANELSLIISKINKKENTIEVLDKIRKEIEKINENKTNLERELARLEAKIEFQPEEKKSGHSSTYLLNLIKSFVEEIRNVLSGEGNLKQPLTDWINKFDSLFKEEKEESKDKVFSNEKNRIREINEKIEKLNNELKKLREEENNFLTGEAEKNKEFRTQVENLEKIKNEVRELERSIDHQILEKEKTDFKKKELENKWTSLGFELDDLLHIKVDNKENLKNENWEKHENTIDKLRLELNAIGDIDKSLIAEANEIEERHEFLSRELEDLQKASKDLEKLINDLEKRIHNDFKKDFSLVNKEFNNYFRLMFGGGKARMKLSIKNKKNKDKDEIADLSADKAGAEGFGDSKEDEELKAGVDIEIKLPGKKINSLEMLSGGEKTLVSLASLFALISVSPPPFLVLDEIDAALDDSNAARFSELIKEFSHKTQFIIVTHNRVTMEAVSALYGVTMGDDGVSKVISLKFEEAEEIINE